jgi:hypothetical protein
MYRLGMSNDMPNIPSMMNVCDSPMPSVSRPEVSTDAVSACWASAHRLAWVDRHHVGAELDPLGLPADRGERGERVEGEVPRRSVRQPEAVELGLLRRGERCGERDGPGHPDEQADPHDVSLRRPPVRTPDRTVPPPEGRTVRCQAGRPG